MFYNVGRARSAASADTEGKDGRHSRSDGRTSRGSDEEGRWTKRSRTPSTLREGYPLEDGTNDDLEPFEEADEEEQDDRDPFIYVPKCMLGQPLKDFDSGQENTFVVVQKKLGKQVVFRFSTDKSLFLLKPNNKIRRLMVYVATHQYFEIFILLTIIINCVFMALSENYPIPEYIFQGIYTVEMVVKILSKGFILHPFSYLRNAWNWLDFVVVLIGYVTMSPALNSFSGIRTFRVLRALKTISTVKGLKAMVNTLLNSMKMMTDVLILTVFFIAIFALIGLQMFMGKLRSRCVKIPSNSSHSIWDPSYSGDKGCIIRESNDNRQLRKRRRIRNTTFDTGASMKQIFIWS